MKTILMKTSYGVNNAKVVGLIPVGDINLRAGLDDLCGCLPTQNIP